MGAATVATLVVVGVIVAALALFVFAVALGLQKLSGKLENITAGLRGVKDQTRPVTPVLTSILGEVTAIEQALTGVLGAVGEALGAAPPPSATMAEAVSKARRGQPAATGGHAENGWDDEYEDEGDAEAGGMAAAVAAARRRMGG